MQGLLKSAFLVCGMLNAFLGTAQSNTGSGQQEPVTNQAPAVNLNNSNTNNIRLEEKNSEEIPVLEELKPGNKPQKKEAAKQPAYSGKEMLQDSQAATKARMMQQFNVNQVNASRQYSRRSATFQEQTAMDESVLYLKAAEPASFERFFYSWLAGHYDISRVSDLRNAEKIQPLNPEVLKQKAMYYTVADQPDSLSGVLQTLDTLGYFTEGQLMYAEDLNLSCAPGSVLIVHGFDDYLAAAYMKQPASDHSIVSLDLMQSESYRELLAANKLTIPVQRDVNVAFLQQFCEANHGRNLQLSMTIPADYLQPLKSKLYVEGLTFTYSDSPADTYIHNEQLWSAGMNKLLLSDLKNDRFHAWVANYKVFLLALKDQLYLHKTKLMQDDLDAALEDIDNTLNAIDSNRH